jgi:hypothetical protein
MGRNPGKEKTGGAGIGETRPPPQNRYLLEGVAVASVVAPFFAFFAFFGFSVFVVSVPAALASFFSAKHAPESPITSMVAIAIFFNFVSPVSWDRHRPAHSSCEQTWVGSIAP